MIGVKVGRISLDNVAAGSASSMAMVTGSNDGAQLLAAVYCRLPQTRCHVLAGNRVVVLAGS